MLPTLTVIGLALLALQNGDLKTGLAKAAQQAGSGDFAAAAATLEAAGAGQSKDAAALTALGTYLLRDAEAKAAAGSLAGLAVVDAFSAAADVLRRAAAASGAPPEAYVNWSEALLNTDDQRNAAKAVDGGLERHPDDLSLLLQRGRVHGALAAKAATSKKAEHYEAAAAAYRRARDRHAQDAASCVRLGEVEVLLAGLEDRERHLAAAKACWQEALARDPSAVDLNTMGRWLGNDAAADLLAEANQEEEDPTRLWYQAVFELNSSPPRWAAAKQHFERVLELNPAFTNTWYYLASGAMAEGTRLQQAGEGALAEAEYVFAATAWSRYLKDFGSNQIQALAALEDQGEGFLAQVRWLEGQAINAGHALDAAQLAQWRTAARPQDPEAWNNLGFFLREAGQHERSLAAYSRALELAPGDPSILNDTAVILHYYLRRDDAEAKRLYALAKVKAEEILANPGDRTPEQLQIVRIALRDATNNLARLEAGRRDNN